jgi:hypothetical protein
MGSNAVGSRNAQTLRVGAVGQHCCNLAWPLLLLLCLKNGLHIRATARDQDHDVVVHAIIVAIRHIV